MRSRSKLNFGQRVALELLWLLCRLFSITPRWFRYGVVAHLIYLIIYRCLGYRKAVVDKNLKNSFPSKNDEQRKQIRKGFYHYLAEVMVSTLSLASGRADETLVKGEAIDELRERTKGQSWVAMTAHFGLWEYLIFWAQYADQSLVAVYHPLENRLFDELFRRLRNHKNIVTVPLKETMRYCLEHPEYVEGRNYVVGLIADQNPPRRPNSEWFKFLNQDSIFFDGGEKLALKLKMPVYFIYQRRLGRGAYGFEYKLIHDGVEAVEPYEITRRYIKMLEEIIEETPHLWLWSHRRWKHNPKRWKHMKQ